MNKIRLIIGREYFSRVKKKSFLIMTILGPLLIVGMMLLIVYMGTSDDRRYKVYIYNSVDNVLPITLKNKGDKYMYTVGTKSMDSASFKQTDYNVYIDMGDRAIANSTGNAQVLMMYKDAAPGLGLQKDLSDQLAVALWTQRLLKSGVTVGDSLVVNNTVDVQNILNKYGKVSFQTMDVDSNERTDKLMEAAGVGTAMTFIIYFFIFLFGVQVMRGVIEEKTSRIVEVVISSVKPFQLMMGKIIGIAFVGLTQFAIWIALTTLFVTLIMPHLPDMNPASIDSYQVSTEIANTAGAMVDKNTGELNGMYDLLFNRIPWGLLISVFLFYFLFGYLLYGSLFAAVGSAVDGEADTQQFILPVSIPLIFGLYMGMTMVGAGNLESTTMSTLSIVPLTSPVVMPIRIAAGTYEWWELLLSMASLVAAFLFFTWVAGRIYRIGILMYGKKASYKELFKWMFYR